MDGDGGGEQKEKPNITLRSNYKANCRTNRKRSDGTSRKINYGGSKGNLG